MKPIGMMQALRLCGAYEKAPQEKRSAIREERLRTLVDYARRNSPYYGNLYQGVPENWSHLRQRLSRAFQCVAQAPPCQWKI